MAGTVSGNIRLVAALNVAIPAGAGAPANYNIPISTPDIVTNYAAGTAANQANRVYYVSGTANAAAVSIDLTTVVTLDGSTGFSHVRDLIVVNDATNGNYGLAFGNDGVATNLYMAGLTTTNGTTLQYAIQPGGMWRHSKPLGTAGDTINSTIKNLRIDPGANSIAYRVLVVGD